MRAVQETINLIRIRRELGIAGQRREMPRQRVPKLMMMEYGKALDGLVVAPMRAVMSPLLEELPRLIAAANRERMDAGEGKRARELVDQARRKLEQVVKPEAVERIAEQFASRVSTANRIQLTKQVRAALGTDVFINDRRLVRVVDGFVHHNVSLIKDIPAELASNVEKAVQNALTSGTLHRDLAKTLEDKFGFAEDRAARIARDQIGKLYGQVNVARQKDLGIRRFTWRTMDDGKVRDEHEEREGEVYFFDDPPDGELPGEPVNCRCTADPVFADILDALEE